MATRKGGGKINHYWLIKNVMGMLMEDMMRNWILSWITVRVARDKMIELDDLNGMESTLS